MIFKVFQEKYTYELKDDHNWLFEDSDAVCF